MRAPPLARWHGAFSGGEHVVVGHCLRLRYPGASINIHNLSTTLFAKPRRATAWHQRGDLSTALDGPSLEVRLMRAGRSPRAKKTRKKGTFTGICTHLAHWPDTIPDTFSSRFLRTQFWTHVSEPTMDTQLFSCSKTQPSAWVLSNPFDPSPWHVICVQ